MRGTGKQWKVAIIEDESETRSLLLTFLGSMGCECRATSSEKALDIITQEDFDAVLLDLQCRETAAEQLLVEIADTHPELTRRILAITDDDGTSPTRKLIQQYRLAAPVPRKRLFLQLWSSLQSIFVLTSQQNAVTQRRQIGRLIFDSFHQPLPVGVRAYRPSARQLVFEHGNFRVDLVIEPRPGVGRMAIVGQLLNSVEPRSKTENLPVALLGSKGPLTATTTNRFGEFLLEFDLPENPDLKIGVGEDSWLLLPLEGLNWAKSRMREA